MMNGDLLSILVEERTRELLRAADQARLAASLTPRRLVRFRLPGIIVEIRRYSAPPSALRGQMNSSSSR